MIHNKAFEPMTNDANVLDLTDQQARNYGSGNIIVQTNPIPSSKTDQCNDSVADLIGESYKLLYDYHCDDTLSAQPTPSSSNEKGFDTTANGDNSPLLKLPTQSRTPKEMLQSICNETPCKKMRISYRENNLCTGTVPMITDGTTYDKDNEPSSSSCIKLLKYSDSVESSKVSDLSKINTPHLRDCLHMRTNITKELTSTKNGTQPSTASSKLSGDKYENLEKYLEECLKNRLEKSKVGIGLSTFFKGEKRPSSKPPSLQNKKLESMRSSPVDDPNSDTIPIIEPIRLFMRCINKTLKKLSVEIPLYTHSSNSCSYGETLQKLRNYVQNRYSTSASQMSHCLLSVMDDAIYSTLRSSGKLFLLPLLLTNNDPSYSMLIDKNLMKAVRNKINAKSKACINSSKFEFDDCNLPSCYNINVENVATNEIISSAKNMAKFMTNPDFIGKLLLRNCLGMVMSFNSCREITRLTELSLLNVEKFVYSLPETKALVCYVREQKSYMNESTKSASSYKYEDRSEFLARQWSIIDRIVATATEEVKNFVNPISNCSINSLWKYLLTEGLLLPEGNDFVRSFMDEDKDKVLSALKEHLLMASENHIKKTVSQVRQNAFEEPTQRVDQPLLYQ
ncbi:MULTISPECIES: hypothetical protein [Candidatus Ichthyocystis]|uniref:Uncharacterized protein n=1 Tax=Candidatus Ichthyocystis hellenicum TaxID=1561003 RepID=A0A0S4M3V2_9BURK|nr:MULTISPECIES: hypothetical protein [Ichthyocystis]CUT17644.1 hypothetical protein Ark11_0821 [Candidatus Ichthyocystis hellenicum]